MLRSVLIANRGEIAVRIIRACRDLGVEAIAVYSDADRDAPHVRLADRAICIGPAMASESYLVIDKILDAAQRTGAEAIHPGYGFLAERAAFADAVVGAGLVFVGPSAATISAMGDKTEARSRMQAAGVPIVPGAVKAIETPDEAREVAEGLGFPLLLKASAGGGGKGMRIVEGPEDLARAWEAASREAVAAFGDGSVYLERYLGKPRHIEIQVLGDHTGNVLHLGERECSIQRRHQKLVEEAPSAVLTSEQREQMGEAAVKAARAVDYQGAGTVEFLFQDDEFFFLEMNTRIQVEHPVTELVTGVDLVEWQIRIASGEAMPWAQNDIRLEGHAIECRITSEDVRGGFLPATGVINDLRVPSGRGVRWDAGVERGSEIGLFYDPLIAKLIVSAEDREAAIDRMSRALRELVVDGVETSTALLRAIMNEPDFRAGDLTIRYLEEHPDLMNPPLSGPTERDVALAAVLLSERQRERERPRLGPGGETGGFSSWKRAGLPGGGAS